MNKTILKSVRQYKKESLLAPLFVVFEVTMEILIPYMMAKIIDIGIKNNDLGYVIKLGLLLLVMALMAMFFGFMSGRFSAIASAGFAKNLRHDIFYKIQDFSFKNIDKFSPSSLVTRLTTDITNVQMAYMMGVRVLARSPIMMSLALIMTIRINPKISIIFFIAIPIFGLILMSILKIAHPKFIEVFAQYDVLNNVVSENINAQRVVKAYVREDFEKEKFNNFSQKIYNLFTNVEKIIALNFPLILFVIYTVVLLIFFVGGRSIVDKSMTAGQLTSVVVYSIQILMSVIMVSVVVILMMIAEASIDRITEILKEEPGMKNVQDGVKEVKNGDIEFKDVSFSYSDNMDRCSLKNINLKIKSGETIGIIGATGSAKSTFVHLIPRLYDVTKGEILVGGVNVKNYDIAYLREEVSMVLQKNTLFRGSIIDNIRWGDENSSPDEVKYVCELAQADGFINEFENKYDEQIYEGGNNVSGGQKQRLCIARALLKKPKILILDDSTSAVDTKTDLKIRKAFRENLKDTTKIIIAQRISSIEDADKIIVLDNGSVVGFDTPENLLKNNEIYKENYEFQKKGGSLDE